MSLNLISQDALKSLIKLSLTENRSLICFDARYNPGCKEKARKQIALCLLRNLEQMKKKRVDIKQEWIRPEVLTFKIPNRILQGLGIERADTTFNESSLESSPKSTKKRGP